MKKKPQNKSVITNKRAKFDYQLIDEFEAGIILTGAETKSVRAGRVQLNSTYVTIKDSEVFVIGLKINPLITNKAQLMTDSEERTRKLLLHSSEIEKLQAAKNGGLTIIVTSIRTKSRFIKLRLATAKGRKKFDKRQVIKAREFRQQSKLGDI